MSLWIVLTKSMPGRINLCWVDGNEKDIGDTYPLELVLVDMRPYFCLVLRSKRVLIVLYFFFFFGI